MGDPFVGRAAQLAQLQAWADGVMANGVGRFVLVVGEAGSGKTRLCAELARLGPPAAVAWSRCWEEGGPPLWPWPDLIAELTSAQEAPPEPVPATDGRDRFGLFRTVTERLRTLCERRPAIVLVDDLHAADPDVLLLTRFVARSLHRFPLLLVATWRTGGDRDAGDEAGAGSELAALAREAAVVDLPPFTADDVTAYLTSTGHGPVGPDDVARLLDWTGGNPMYIAELARQGWADGDAGAGLAYVLARRVADIHPGRRRVIGTAALLGAGATVTETARVLGVEPATVLGALREGTSGVTRVGNEIRFTHDLLRDAYVAALPEDERHRLHVAARDAVCGDDADCLVRRAHHAVEAAPLSAGDTAEAVGACLEAAGVLHGALAFEQAAVWARRACLLAHGSPDTDPAVRATALLAHADAVQACGRLAESRELYARAVAPAEAVPGGRLLARAALGLGGVWVEEQRDELSRRRTLELCRRALSRLAEDDGDDVLAARLRVRMAAERGYDGTGTVEEVTAAVERVRRLGDPAATAEVLSQYHHTLLLRPDSAAARLAIADELLDVTAKAEASVHSLFGLCWRTVDLYHLGGVEAERSFVELRERTSALGSQSVQYIVAVLDVMRTFRRGELDRAEAMAGEALRLGDAAGDADAVAYYGAHMLTVRWAQGRLGELRDTVRDVIESSTLRRRDVIYPALLAYAHALRGEHAEARAVLDGLLAGGLDAIPPFSTWAGTVAVLVETAAELGDGDLATALADRFLPVAHLPVMPSLAVACLGPGERVMGRARATAGRLDEAAGWLRDAVTANRRLGNRPVGVLLRADLAEVLRRRGGPGDGERAAKLLAVAVREGRRLGMAGWVERWERGSDGPTAGVHGGLDAGSDAPPLAGTLVREGGAWRVGIGSRTAVVKDVVGMRYVAELVARAGTDVPAADLSALVAGVTVVDHGPADPTLDDRARAEYAQRLRRLERELDLADRAGDAERGRRAADERDALLAALRRETGLGGRPRRMSDESERTRMRVSKAIHRALARVTEADRTLGRALESRIRTGYVCRYSSDPGQPITWTVRVD